jgi:hypothetical protein
MKATVLVPLHRAVVRSAPVQLNAYNYVQPLTKGDSLSKLRDDLHIANIVDPKVRVAVDLSAAIASDSGVIPLTVISTDTDIIKQDVLQAIVAGNLGGDDVFTEDFLQSVMIVATAANATLNSGATPS